MNKITHNTHIRTFIHTQANTNTHTHTHTHTHTLVILKETKLSRWVHLNNMLFKMEASSSISQ